MTYQASPLTGSPEAAATKLRTNLWENPHSKPREIRKKNQHWGERQKINPKSLGPVFSLCCHAGLDAASVKVQTHSRLLRWHLMVAANKVTAIKPPIDDTGQIEDQHQPFFAHPFFSLDLRTLFSSREKEPAGTTISFKKGAKKVSPSGLITQRSSQPATKCHENHRPNWNF